MDNAFAKPIEPSEPQVQQPFPEQMGQVPKEPDTTDAKPSLYHHLNKISYLGKQLGMERDNDLSGFVNHFILGSLDVEGVADTPEGYKMILDRLLATAGLTVNHSTDNILQKLYYYIIGKKLNPADDLVLSVLNNRQKNGKFY